MLKPYIEYIGTSLRYDKTKTEESTDEKVSLVNYDLSYLIACIPTCFKKSEDRSENALTSSILVDKMTHKSLFSRELKEEEDDDVMTEISSEDYQFIKSLGNLSVVKNNDTDLFLRDENSETTPKETKESNISLQMNLVLQQEKEKKELGKVLRKQPSIVQNKSDFTIRDDDTETTFFTTITSNVESQSDVQSTAVEMNSISMQEKENEVHKPAQAMEELGKMEIQPNQIIQERESETTLLATNESKIETQSKPETTAVEKNADSLQENTNETKVEEEEHFNDFDLSPISKQMSLNSPSGTDLSGTWKIIVDDDFRKEYDGYLKCLGFNGIIRSVAVRVIGHTVEEIQQLEKGQQVWIKGTNPKGVWERTLMTRPYKVITPEKEELDGEAWWQGTRHNSFLRGSKKYGGGDFEAIRYIDEDGLYICESTFVFNDKTKDPAHVRWRFQKLTQT